VENTVAGTVEIRYAGVVVGRSTDARKTDGNGLFVALPDPLPVGTVIELGVAEQTVAARVERVIESAEVGIAGMHLLCGDEAVALDLRSVAPPAPANESPAPAVVAEAAPEAPPEAAPEAAPEAPPAANVTTASPVETPPAEPAAATPIQNEPDSAAVAVPITQGDSTSRYKSKGKKKRR